MFVRTLARDRGAVRAALPGTRPEKWDSAETLRPLDELFRRIESLTVSPGSSDDWLISDEENSGYDTAEDGFPYGPPDRRADDDAMTTAGGVSQITRP